jgi:hypothetical protein
MVWPMASDVLPAGDGVGLVDSDDAPQVTVAYRIVQSQSSIVASGTTGLTLVQESVPFDGVNRTTLRWDLTYAGIDFFVSIQARWDAAANAVALTAKTARLDGVSGGLLPKRYSAIVEFTLNDASVAFVETTGVTATFGVTEDGDSLPGAGGVNAIAESQTAFGVLETRVDVRGYVLTETQARAMAEALVLANLSPRAVRSYDLTWIGSTVVRRDDVGRLLATPDGGQGLLVGHSYADDFPGASGGVSVRVEETVEGAPGFIPSDSVWLLNDDGSFWQNDDGSFSAPA